MKNYLIHQEIHRLRFKVQTRRPTRHLPHPTRLIIFRPISAHRLQFHRCARHIRAADHLVCQFIILVILHTQIMVVLELFGFRFHQLLVDHTRLADQSEIHFFVEIPSGNDFAFAPTSATVHIAVLLVRTLGHCDRSGHGVHVKEIGSGAGQGVPDSLIAETARVEVLGGDGGDQLAGKGGLCLGGGI